MIRNLKYLCLTVVAALAFGAAAVPGAQAAAPEFKSEVEPVLYEGDQVVPLIFTIGLGLSSKCTTAHFTGTGKTKASTSLTLTPNYGGCELFKEAAEFKTNGCTYVFNLVAASSPPTANMEIVCPAGKEMEIESKVVECTVKIGAQKALKHVLFSNGGTKKTSDYTMSFILTGIAYEEVGEKCVEPGAHANGEYSGTVTLKGYEDLAGKKGAQVGISVE
jgi:hypothetical protein